MTTSKVINPTHSFDYELIRSNRRTLVVYVKNGKVEVRSPARASLLWIHSFLQANTAWIEQQLAKQKQKQTENLVIADGHSIPFLGQPRLIVVVLGSRQKVILKEGRLYLYIKETGKAKLEKLFHGWLLEQAREYMATQTIKTARMLGLENKLKEVVFRKTKSKWGHCCEDGTIQYNWLTMMAPREVVDYLIAHETSHLKHLNHSAKFWNTVGSICPEYKQLRHWLTDNGHRLWTRSSSF